MMDIQKVVHEILKDPTPDSLEVGPAKRRLKINYKTIDELKTKLKDLEEMGLYVPGEE